MLLPACTWANSLWLFLWGPLLPVEMLLQGADLSLMLQSQMLSHSDTSPSSLLSIKHVCLAAMKWLLFPIPRLRPCGLCSRAWGASCSWSPGS